MDKADKKARLRAWRERELDGARARLPLADAEMEAMFEMLDKRLAGEGCNHTRRLIDAWLAERGHPAEPIYRWLDETGGFCDCEVLVNSEQAWREASRGR